MYIISTTVVGRGLSVNELEVMTPRLNVNAGASYEVRMYFIDHDRILSLLFCSSMFDSFAMSELRGGDVR